MYIPSINSSLIEWLDYIKNIHSKSVDFTLDRVKSIAIDLDLIHPATYIILVGGTNGKGTTCCLLESILLNSGLSVGLYTSPHLISYTERIRISGKELPNKIHIMAMSKIESARSCITLTYFEFITLSALYIFKKAKLDVIILEVGLGGRLDATNVVDPDISAITNVAIDHVEFLGRKRNDIAKEKSGIFRNNKPAIFGEINRPIIIDQIVQKKGATLFARSRDWDICVSKNTWCWWDYKRYKKLYKLPIPTIPIDNAATALSILYWFPLHISRTAILYGLQVARLLGRFQIVSYKPLVILDVGHNPHAANYLVQRLSKIISKIGSVRIVIGMLKSKDIQKTMCYLCSVVDVWYCASLNVMSAFHAQQLSDCLMDNFNISSQCFDNVLDAWNQALLDAVDEDCIIVFGSFHAIGPIIQKIIK